jgi:hypothetical protein
VAKAVPVQVRPWAPTQSPVAITGDLIAPLIGAFLCPTKSSRVFAHKEISVISVFNNEIKKGIYVVYSWVTNLLAVITFDNLIFHFG